MAILKYLIESLNESITPKLPKGIKYSTKQINKGTYMEFTDKIARFETSQGNIVSVHVFPDGDYHEISFDVNGERKEQDRDKDLEILSGVLAIALKVVDKYNISKLKIKADSDRKDTKYKKNLPMKDFDKQYKEIISNVLIQLDQLDLTGKKPSAAMAKVLSNRGETYDPNKNLNMIRQELKTALNSDDIKIPYPHHISGADFFPKEYIDDFNTIVSEFNKRKKSLSDEGVPEFENRRYSIYKRLVNKYFSDWNIEFDDKFQTIYMDRK